MDVEREQQNRFVFLRTLWEDAEGSEYYSVNMFELGEKLGLDRTTVDRVFRYLSGQGLIKGVDIAGGISITHRGIVEVEQAMSTPDRSTDYFPALNVISIGSMSNSVIQQASPHANQDVRIGVDELERIRRAVAEVEARLDELGLREGELLQIHADLATIRAQVSAPTPRKSIVTESLLSLRSILEQAAGTVAATPLVLLITRALGGA